MDILSERKYKIGDVCVMRLEVPPPAIPEQTIIGVDPGTKNLGLAILPQAAMYDKAVIFEVRLERNGNPVARILGIQSLLEDLLYPDRLILSDRVLGIVEGASYADPYRQAEMAEQRAAIVLHLIQKLGIQIEIVPPMTVRKLAFGSAKIKYKEKWPEIPGNAAAALMCAVACAKKQASLANENKILGELGF